MFHVRRMVLSRSSRIKKVGGHVFSARNLDRNLNRMSDAGLIISRPLLVLALTSSILPTPKGNLLMLNGDKPRKEMAKRKENENDLHLLF